MVWTIILGLPLLWAVASNPKPHQMLFLIARSILAAVVVAILLFELGWIPVVRRFYFDHDYLVLRIGYIISTFIFGLGLGLHPQGEVGKKQLFAVSLLAPLAAMPIFVPMIMILSRWNVPRNYGADLTDLIGAGSVLLPGPIPALVGCAIGVTLSVRLMKSATDRA